MDYKRAATTLSRWLLAQSKKPVLSYKVVQTAYDKAGDIIDAAQAAGHKNPYVDEAQVLREALRMSFVYDRLERSGADTYENAGLVKQDYLLTALTSARTILRFARSGGL